MGEEERKMYNVNTAPDLINPVTPLSNTYFGILMLPKSTKKAIHHTDNQSRNRHLNVFKTRLSFIVG